jgi:hypothetical protein
VLCVAGGASALSEEQLRLMAILDGSRLLKGGCDLAGDEVWAVDGGEDRWRFAAVAKMVRDVRAELAEAVTAKDVRCLRRLALGDRDAKSLRVGKVHALRVEAARALLDAAVEAEDLDLALLAADTLAVMYRKIYPPVSVATGVVEAKNAKLLFLLGNGAAARRHAQRALSHLEKLTPESALIAEARGILSQPPLEASAPSDIQLADVQPVAIPSAGPQLTELQPELELQSELQLEEIESELQPPEIQQAADLKCATPSVDLDDASTADSKSAIQPADFPLVETQPAGSPLPAEIMPAADLKSASPPAGLKYAPLPAPGGSSSSCSSSPAQGRAQQDSTTEVEGAAAAAAAAAGA